MQEFHVPTLTLCEAVARFRAAGISTGEAAMANGIEQGVYPFAICIAMQKHRKFEIYEKMLNEYLAERSL